MLDSKSFFEFSLSRMRSALPILFAVLAGAAAACSMSLADNSPDGAYAAAGGGYGGGSGAGADEPDGSIDVASDGDPAPRPGDYSGLCGLTSPRPSDAGPCVAGAEKDGCDPGLQPTDGAPSTPAQTCELVAAEGVLTPTCGFPGEGQYNQPCMNVKNCAAGLGCAVVATPIANQTGGACLDYCCGNFEECPKDTYCTKQHVAEAPDLDIPVCILATKCTLLDDSTCPETLTCAIVRADGTTSCVVPGPGKDGEPCNAEGLCAAGYTCLKLVSTCKQLCRLDHAEDCPMGSTCLSGSGEYPDNYGTCTAGDGYN